MVDVFFYKIITPEITTIVSGENLKKALKEVLRASNEEIVYGIVMSRIFKKAEVEFFFEERGFPVKVEIVAVGENLEVFLEQSRAIQKELKKRVKDLKDQLYAAKWTLHLSDLETKILKNGI